MYIKVYGGHFAVRQQLTEHFKATVIQIFKKIKTRKKK